MTSTPANLNRFTKLNINDLGVEQKYHPGADPYLTGIICKEHISNLVGSLTAISVLDLRENRSDGTTETSQPDVVEKIKKLVNRFLRINRITEYFPYSFSNLQQIIVLNLSGNNLTSTIPEFIFDLKALKELHLDNNKFTGWIPSKIGLLTQLEVVNLMGNRLSGYLPATLLRCVRLKIFNLSGTDNCFSGANGLNRVYELDDISTLKENVISSWSIDDKKGNECLTPVVFADRFFLGEIDFLENLFRDYGIQVSAYLHSKFKRGDTFLSRACHGNDEAAAKLIVSYGVTPILQFPIIQFPKHTVASGVRFRNKFHSNSVAAFHRAIELNQPTIYDILLKSFPELVKEIFKGANGLLPIQTAYNCGTASFGSVIKLLDSDNFPLNESHIDELLPSPQQVISDLQPNLVKFKWDIRFLAFAFSHDNRVKLQSINVHLVGDGVTGKSTIRKTFKAKLKKRTPLMSEFNARIGFRSPRVQTINLGDRTIGCEIETVTDKNLSWRFFDYGGQKRFHGNHVHFLQLPDSIYIVVLSVCDFNLKPPIELFNPTYLERRYEYWLHFLHSIPREQENAHIQVITIVNGKSMALTLWPLLSKENQIGKIAQDYIDKVLDCLSHAQQQFIGKIEFIGKPLCINNNEHDDVQRFVVDIVTKSILERESRHIPKCISCFKNLKGKVFNGDFRNPHSAVDNNEPVQIVKFDPIMRKANLTEVICKMLPAELKWTGASPTECVMIYFCEKMIERLNDLREIILINDSNENTNNSWVLVDLDLLSRNILGGLIQTYYDNHELSSLLTDDDIRECFISDEKFSEFDHSVIVNLLVNIGSCIPIIPIPATDDMDPSQKQQFNQPGNQYQPKFFCPMIQGIKSNCTNVSITPLLFNDNDPGFQAIQRCYKLKDNGTQIFPPGYFERLCASVCALEQQHSNTKTPCPMVLRMFEDKLLIEKITVGGLRVQTIIWFEALKFTIRVSTATAGLPQLYTNESIEKSSDSPADFATEFATAASIRITSIHELIMKLKRPEVDDYCCKLKVDNCGNILEDDIRFVYFVDSVLESSDSDQESVIEAKVWKFGLMSASAIGWKQQQEEAVSKLHDSVSIYNSRRTTSEIDVLATSAYSNVGTASEPDPDATSCIDEFDLPSESVVEPTDNLEICQIGKIAYHRSPNAVKELNLGIVLGYTGGLLKVFIYSKYLSKSGAEWKDRVITIMGDIVFLIKGALKIDSFKIRYYEIETGEEHVLTVIGPKKSKRIMIKVNTKEDLAKLQNIVEVSIPEIFAPARSLL